MKKRRMQCREISTFVMAILPSFFMCSCSAFSYGDGETSSANSKELSIRDDLVGVYRRTSVNYRELFAISKSINEIKITKDSISITVSDSFNMPDDNSSYHLRCKMRKSKDTLWLNDCFSEFQFDSGFEGQSPEGIHYPLTRNDSVNINIVAKWKRGPSFFLTSVSGENLILFAKIPQQSLIYDSLKNDTLNMGFLSQLIRYN